MLTLEPALRRRSSGGKFALALAGGGPLGAFYELGALHAIEEVIVGRELTEYDMYVGVSSGSLLAAGLANGFDSTRMGAAHIQGESALVPFSPRLLLQPAIVEYVRRIARLPRALRGSARQWSADALSSVWPAMLGVLTKIIPLAVFDSAPLERYLHELFTMPEHTDDFRALRSQLRVVATELDTGRTVVFGDAAHASVPISRAVIASAALPGLYAPVSIQGRDYVDGALVRTMYASLALEAGCDFVICINPLVPFDASHGRHRRKLADEGFDTVLGQTFRTLIHSRMQVGMASFRTRFPHADTLLLEPDRHDELMFFTNVFRYAGRHRLAEHAYQQTRRDFRAHARALAALLRHHGLDLDRRKLNDPRRTFATAAHERAARVRRTTHRLADALGQLERALTRTTGLD